jgi:8-oxo-dGTP pyrophosphatase MutT (NUDIX family)
MDKIDYIHLLINGMTVEERGRLLVKPFEKLWSDLWNAQNTRQFRTEFENARRNFENLKATGDRTGKTLAQYIETATGTFTDAEWGFPKGRRNPKEDDINCAIREFEEETGIMRSQVRLIQNMEPVSETFFGDNNVHYCHKYYLAYVPAGVNFADISTNIHMSREVGDIGWFTMEEALTRIRSENVEKREILLRVSGIIRNYCFGML